MAATIIPPVQAMGERLVDALVSCKIIPEAAGEAACATFGDSSVHKPAQVIDYLVEQGHLTRFQGDVCLQGQPHDLVLSQFVLLDKLGAGSMGAVYKARSTRDDGWYAVKIVPRRNVANLNEVAEKVKALKDIRHPRVSALISLGAVGERVFLAWPFLEGGEKLDTFVKRNGKLSPRQALQIATQIASGLQPYHDAGLFHGLLKASDILIGSDKRVRLLDFGVGFLLATDRGKALLDTMTNNKTLARGLDCTPPESLLNPLDRSPAGDRYSLGCILYFCLAGQYPFTAENPLQKMMAHQLETPPPVADFNPEVTPKLATVVATLMRKLPGERYGNASEALMALQVAAGLNPTAPAPKSGANGVHPVTSPDSGKALNGSAMHGSGVLIGTSASDDSRINLPGDSGVRPPTTPRPAPAVPARPTAPPPVRAVTTRPPVQTASGAIVVKSSGKRSGSYPAQAPASHSGNSSTNGRAVQGKPAQAAPALPAANPVAAAYSAATQAGANKTTTLLVVLGVLVGVIIGGVLFWLLGRA